MVCNFFVGFFFSFLGLGITFTNVKQLRTATILDLDVVIYKQKCPTKVHLQTRTVSLALVIFNMQNDFKGLDCLKPLSCQF